MTNMRKIKYQKKTWTVKTLAPIQFIECSYWPFAHYRTSEDIEPTPEKPEIPRDWKLPPKKKLDDEAKLEAAWRYAYKLSCGVGSDADYEEIKKDRTLHFMLFNEMYALTYELTLIERCFTPQKIISRDFAEGLAIKAKAMNIEPYSLLADLSEEKPELYNPKRYDFNFFILGIGWQKEIRDADEAKAKYEADIKKSKNKTKSGKQ